MDFTNMKTPKLFLRYVVPQMVALVFNSIYFIVDGAFIGRRLGSEALAAAGVAVPVVECTIALAMLFSVGAGVLASAAAGRKDFAAARAIFNLAMRFTVAFSVALGVLGAVFTVPLARALGADDAILADTVTYLRTFLAFSPFLILSFSLSTFARNDGKPALAMWALTIGSLSNVLLDWVFMYPLNMGIGGAALATGLGPVLSVALLLPHFLRKKGSLYFQRQSAPPRMLGKILAGGLPAFVAEFSIGFVTLLYNLAIVQAGLGPQGLAAYVVIGYAALICLTAFLGAAQGVQPAVSFFAGAGQPGRIRGLLRASLCFGLGLAALFYAALYFGGGAFYGIFAGGNAPLLALMNQISPLYFLCLPFAAVNILLISFLQSAENNWQAMVVSLCRSTLPVLVFLWLLPGLWPGAGLWLALTCAEAFTTLLALPLYRAAGRSRLRPLGKTAPGV